MSTLSLVRQNDSDVEDVPASDDIDDDMELFNLSTLLDNDLLPEELPPQVDQSQLASLPHFTSVLINSRSAAGAEAAAP